MEQLAKILIKHSGKLTQHPKDHYRELDAISKRAKVVSFLKEKLGLVQTQTCACWNQMQMKQMAEFVERARIKPNFDHFSKCVFLLYGQSICGENNKWSFDWKRT